MTARGFGQGGGVWLRSLGLAAAVLLGTAGPAARAASLEVSPVTHELAPSKSALSMTVTNHGHASVVVQVRGFDWSQSPTDGEEQLRAAEDVILSPPIFNLEPGRSQIVRALFPSASAGSGPAVERTWRLLIDEIPGPGGSEPIRFALRLSIPVFRAAASQGPAALQWRLDPSRQAVVVRNQGGRRERVRELTVTDAQGQPQRLPGPDVAYLLAGTERRWPLPARAAVPAGQPLRLSAHTDAGRIEVPLVSAP